MNYEDVVKYNEALEAVHSTIEDVNKTGIFRRKLGCILFAKEVGGLFKGKWLCQILDDDAETSFIEARAEDPARAICLAHSKLLEKLK